MNPSRSSPTDPSIQHRHTEAVSRFRQAMASGRNPEIEDYIVAVPARERPGLVHELLRIELEIRRSRGDSVLREDYSRRFQAFPDVIEAIFSGGASATLHDEPLGDRGTVNEHHTNAYVPSEDEFLDEPPAAGGRLGRFEIRALLGQGAFGSVFRAHDTQLDRDVALKVPRAGVLATPDDVNRFLREARSAAQLHHPNIVAIHEAGRIGPYHYIAADFVEGTTLRRVLTDRGAYPVRDACQLVRQLAQGLHHAHEAGIIHRDIKPENILIDASGTPLVADFGLAHRDEGDQLQTQDGARMGTPAYMSPEQASGHSHLADARSDLWGLGIVLYELLTGRRPFKGNMAELTRQIVESDPVSPRQLVRGIPRDVATICLKCLEKKPDRRYASCGALAEDLDRFLANRPILARKTPAWERAWKWRRRRPAAATALGVGLVLLVAGLAGGLWYWDAKLRVKIEHYVYYAKRFGVPEGVERLTPEQAAQREFSIQLHRQGGMIVRMEVVNGRGFYSDRYTADPVIAEDKDWYRRSMTRKAVRFDYRRDESGKLTDEVAYDMAGKVLWTLHFATPTVGHYKDRKGFPDPRVGSGAAYVEFVWSPEGFPAETRFLDRDGKPKPIADGVYAIRTEHEIHGLPVREDYLGPDGLPTLNAEGFATAIHVRDARGAFVLEKHFLGIDGRPIHNNQGFAGFLQEFDAAGNFSRLTLLDTDHQPTFNKDGVAGYRMEYDATGCRIRQVALGADGRPTASTYGICEIRYAHDARGYEIELAYFDADGNPCLHKSGNHIYRKQINAAGDLVLQEYFDLDGQPTINRENLASRVETQYDEWGNQTEAAYFAVDGRPSIGKIGMSRYTNRYDDRGRAIEFAYFGTDGRPIAIDDRYAIARTEYDERGNTARESYYGIDGQPCLHKSGYSSITRKHDARGNLVERNYFDRDGQPVLHRDGYASIKYQYDDRDRQTQVAYFDREGRPALHRRGYSSLRKRYDHSNNIVEWSYLDTAGQPTLIDDGYSRSVSTFDANRRQLETRYYDAADQPVNIADGYARFTWKYDQKGNIVETAYFAADDSPARQRNGYSVSRGQFNPRGKQVEWSYFGTRGEPVDHSDGYHRLVETLDDRDNVIQRAYFGTDGQPVPGPRQASVVRFQHDARGNNIRETYWNEKNQPILDKFRGHRFDAVYDDHDRVIERRVFGIRGEPIITTRGFHGGFIRFDDVGNEIEVRYFGLDGQPVLHALGFARRLREFDPFGRRVFEKWFGVDDRPTLMEEGVGSVRIGYDSFGNLVHESYYGLDGQPTLRKEGGFSSMRMTFDERQREIGRKYFGTRGEPIRFDGLYHETRTILNNQGKYLQRRYFDTDGQPAVGTDGMHGYAQSYDSQGNRISRRYLGPDGTIAQGPENYAEQRFEYDINGRIVSTSHFDVHGKPVRTKAGYSVVRRSYDKAGLYTPSYFDERGQALIRRLVAVRAFGDTIQAGDLLVSIQQRIPTSTVQLLNVLAPWRGKPTSIQIRRGHELRNATIPAQTTAEQKAFSICFEERYLTPPATEEKK